MGVNRLPPGSGLSKNPIKSPVNSFKCRFMLTGEIRSRFDGRVAMKDLQYEDLFLHAAKQYTAFNRHLESRRS
jgi:hypothetical protein